MRCDVARMTDRWTATEVARRGVGTINRDVRLVGGKSGEERV